MEDNRFRGKFNDRSDQELNFTKEDRTEVIEKIHSLQKSKIQKKSLILPIKIIPVTTALLIVGLCLFLFLPSMLPATINKEISSISVNKETNPTVAGTTGIEEAKVLTTLITVKSEEMDDRIYLNLLLSYSTDKKMVKVVSIPYDTYVPVAEKDEGTVLNDKLLFAYNHGGAKNVRTIVSNLFDIPIDYHAVIELRSFSSLIDSIGGVEYGLQDDITVRGITQAVLEFKKGANHLNGEGIVALMMAATEPNNLDEGNLLKLMEAVIDKAENQTSSNKLKESLANSLSDIQLLDKDIRAIKQISLRGGMIDDAITISNTEGKHIYRFDDEFLNAVSKELTTFK
ncbi:Membrane-bound protein lytR [Solibacillus isronensis B3W22]|uniref:Membrane-bound protein lytR n=1 Tax=Solibacillus isronensis B3W22 TaxID=1224748 RepID=K1L2Y9_9BACL|nr:LCP family protein [Solibacillus isronensis]AMO85815.1 transcriptional regulator [Solibacillus silvestris]EKB46472.1 Membrane-bound protein lytR [Solibacillus isronensis B3W22]